MKKSDILFFNDHFQNYKRYSIPKAQLVIADIPYNIGINAYGSNPCWYVNGDNSNGESEKAGKSFFDTDKDFKPAEFMHFCSHMMKKEQKSRNTAPCMIVFCEFWAQRDVRDLAVKYGINGCINLVFRKNFSAQVLKANMRVVGNAEYALLLYRDKLPKFNNNGKMVFNIMDWERDPVNDPMYRKIHPTQKPVKLLEKLIKLFTDPGDVIIDPVAGSGSALIAAQNTGRIGIGFEIKKPFYRPALEWISDNEQIRREIKSVGISNTLLLKKFQSQKLLFA
jgi:site-specific DNA-methyltransferase (adenine-specific)